MRRAITSVLTALSMGLLMAVPASADVTVKFDEDSDMHCGSQPGQGQDNYSIHQAWPELLDQNTNTNDDDEIRYYKGGSIVVKDSINNKGELRDVWLEVRKLQADGTGYVVHYAEHVSFSSSGSPGSAVSFSLFGVNNINRTRKPFVWIKTEWTGGSCMTRTAAFDAWIP